jgi:hypothetical protein
MAIIGQCKACGDRVSDQAATCPHCGQPHPYLPVPAPGSVHRARIAYVGERDEYGRVLIATLPSGIRGSVSVPRQMLMMKFQAGSDIRVRIA